MKQLLKLLALLFCASPQIEAQHSTNDPVDEYAISLGKYNAEADADISFGSAQSVMIHTGKGLAVFADLVNKGFLNTAKATLTADIDLSTVCGKEIGNWTPIGTDEHPFCGTFDGCGHYIRQLYIRGDKFSNINGEIDEEASDRFGLFGTVASDAMLHSFGVEGSISGSGVLGGIVAVMKGTDSRIFACLSSVSVSGDRRSSSNGGIVGGASVGASIIACVSNGQTFGVYNAGGIVGNMGRGASVISCIASGEVRAVQGSGAVYVGGSDETCRVEYCSSSNVYADGGNTAVQGEAKVIDCPTNVTLLSSIAKHEGGINHPDNAISYDLGDDLTYTTRHSDYHTEGFQSLWNYNLHGKGYAPLLYWQEYDNYDARYIATAEELQQFAKEVNDGTATKQVAVLTADIDLSTVCGKGLASWTPIGYAEEVEFKGIFDGRGHTVSNLYIKDDKGILGLFGSIGGYARIQNVSVSGAILGAGSNVGGIVGQMTNINTTISCVESRVDITAKSMNVGGIVGYSIGNISLSCATGSISSALENTGGIVGYINNKYGTSGSIFACYFAGDLPSPTADSFGGIAGRAKDAKLNYCYTALPKACNAAGLIGFDEYTETHNSAFTNLRCDGDNGINYYTADGTMGALLFNSHHTLDIPHCAAFNKEQTAANILVRGKLYTTAPRNTDSDPLSIWSGSTLDHEGATIPRLFWQRTTTH